MGTGCINNLKERPVDVYNAINSKKGATDQGKKKKNSVQCNSTIL